MTVECLFFISWCINGAWVGGRGWGYNGGFRGINNNIKGGFFGGITLLIDWFLHQGGLLSFLVLSTFLGDIFWDLFCLVIVENEKWRRTRSEWRTL